MAAQQLDDGNEAGCIVGRASGKIGFFGTTPVDKTSVTALASTAAVFSVAKTGIFGFASSTAAIALDANVRLMHAALKSYGII